MSNFQRIGFFLTDDKIVITEFIRNKLQSIISSPLDLSQNQALRSDVAAEAYVVELCQKLLREHKIEPGQVSVSIPIKEIFLRSFVVPLIPANELNNVVFYEAKKYVPFDLKLLEYVYQAVPFTENRQKRLRIIFYAVRKQTLEQYERILKQLGCKPLAFEPSQVSLARYLITQNYLKPDQKAVVIYTHENYGQIIFYERGIAYFVREFPLSVADVHDPKAIADVTRIHLLREIQKSFDYYSRQFSQEKIKEVLVLSSALDKELVTILTDELSVKTKTVASSITLGLQTFTGMDILCAHGSCITQKVPTGFVSFNFLQNKTTIPSSTPAKALSWGSINQFKLSTAELSLAVQVAVVGVLILGGAFIFAQIKLHDTKKMLDTLTLQQGMAADKPIEDIKADIKKNGAILDDYKNAFKPSGMTSFLMVLTKALPEGAWLSEVKLQYVSHKRIKVDISGYIYLKDANGQFKAANEYLSLLKADKNLKSVKLELTMQRTKEQEKDVLYFRITG